MGASARDPNERLFEHRADSSVSRLRGGNSGIGVVEVYYKSEKAAGESH